MTNRLDDPNIRQGLENLPRFQTSEGFTNDTMRRLEQRSSRRFRLAPGGIWVIATALVLAIGIFVGFKMLDQRRQQLAYQQRVDAIRSRYQQIQSDVDTLRREAAQSPAVVFLGGTETFDLVVDLADLRAYEEGDPKSRIRPANY
jgi:hypothetical protein